MRVTEIVYYEPRKREIKTRPTHEFLFVVYCKSKRELKRVYRNGCRYNERLNTETGGSN